MSKYRFDIIVILVGGSVSIIELLLDAKLGFFIISITILLELSMLGMRSYTKECLMEYSEIHNLIYRINNKHWHALAKKELLTTKEVLKQMEQGKRELKANEITTEELRLIKSAKKYIYCTYFADSLIKLKIRLNSVSKYNPMMAINASYSEIGSKKMYRKRVFVLDKINVTDPEIKKVLEELNQYYSSDNVNFDVRYIYYSKLREMNIQYHGNLILVDDVECTLCLDHTDYPEDYFEKDQNIVRVINASNIINDKLLEDYKIYFEKVWEMSLPISELL